MNQKRLRKKRKSMGSWKPREERASKRREWDFPGDPVVENLPANAGDIGLILALGRSHMPQGH